MQCSVSDKRFCSQKWSLHCLFGKTFCNGKGIDDLKHAALDCISIRACTESRLATATRGTGDALIWLLVIETVLDFGSGTIGYIRAGTIGDLNGAPWLIVAFYVTTVEVAVGLTIWQLITRRGEPLFKAEGQE